jgi:hypothetical protein
VSDSKRDGPFKLYNAEGLCPCCKKIFPFMLNPGYPPPPGRSKLENHSRGRKYSLMTWGERTLYYLFRLLCDECTARRRRRRCGGRSGRKAGL